MDSGYSGTPLVRKLGIKDGSVVRILNRPVGWALVDAAGPDDALADVIVLFCDWQTDLQTHIEGAMENLVERGGLWIAWPKRASGCPTDLTEDRLRDLILPLGWVDNKVCAIDGKWSGLRFVRRRSPAKLPGPFA